MLDVCLTFPSGLSGAHSPAAAQHHGPGILGIFALLSSMVPFIKWTQGLAWPGVTRGPEPQAGTAWLTCQLHTSRL